MSKVYLFFAQGMEEIESLTVVDLLRRAKIDVTTVSVTGEQYVIGSHNIEVKSDILLENVDWSLGDMIVLPGGMPGTLNLEACTELMKQVDSYVNQGKRVAAICAAPTILGHRGILKGKRACCYPGKEDQLDGAKVVYDSVCVDGSIITGRGLGTAIDFALAIIEELESKKLADDIATSVVYSR